MGGVRGCSRRRAAKVFMIYEASEQMLQSGSCLARSPCPVPHCMSDTATETDVADTPDLLMGEGGGVGVLRWQQQQLDMDANTDIKIAL